MTLLTTLVLLGLVALAARLLVSFIRFHYVSPARYFAGKHVWLVGASSGLGEGMLLQLAAHGAHLSISSRRVELLEELRKQAITKFPSTEIRIFPLDVTNSEEQIERTYETIKKEVRAVDIVIYNAGINQESVLTHDLSPKAAMNVLGTNFIGALHIIQRVLKDMKRLNSGHIVTVSSLAAHRGLPESGVYGASKAAMSNYVEALRVELRASHPGIAFTDIQPGFVRTPILAHVKYDLPLVMEVPCAVDLMLKAVKERRAFYSFPMPLYAALQLAHWVPCSVYDFVIGQALKRRRA